MVQLDMRIEVMLQAKMEGKLKRREAAAEAASALDLAQSTVEQLQKAATKLQRQTHSLQEAADINNSVSASFRPGKGCPSYAFHWHFIALVPQAPALVCAASTQRYSMQ